MTVLPGYSPKPQRRQVEAWPGDAPALAKQLRSSVSGEVRFDDGSRGLYATDSSNYRQVPIGVVVPKTVDDVIATVAACRDAGAPVLSRGGGTSLAGQCCNVAVVMDFSKYLHNVLEVDPDRRVAHVQPGLVLDDLGVATEPHGLFFPPDPSTHNRCTIGGMIGNNSCGVHSVMAGRTSDNVEELDVLLYDGTRLRVGPTSDEDLGRKAAQHGRRGQIYRSLRDLRNGSAELIRDGFPELPRRVSGYNLVDLLPEKGCNVARALVGSEGTCATVLEATLNLRPRPPQRTLLLLGFDDVFSAADAVPDVLEHAPVGLEGLDDHLISNLERKHQQARGRGLLPEGGGWLIAEFGADTSEESRHAAERARDALGRGLATRLVSDPAEQQEVWEVREAGLGATAHVPGEPEAWPGWEDSAVRPADLGAYLRDLRKLYDDYGYIGAFYGHFGDGCLHVRSSFDFATEAGIGRFESFIGDAADLVVSYGGSLSGEHGDGQARGELLDRMYPPELMTAFRDFKTIWDPDWKMNPGKVVATNAATANLRLGADYRPWQPETVFAFGDDNGNFADAALRCVGVGECRKTQSGTMCPSYMATREEKHSTRGRARLLYEMLEGNPVRDGWRDEHVHEALDLCLSCKACKSECPVNVDMATYKSEFLHHHFEGRLRPRAAYSMGLIPLLARIAARIPRLANTLTSAPVTGSVVKRLGGVSTRRSAPRFAPDSLEAWLRRRRPRQDGTQVLLWLDTFNNFFSPDIGKAAVEALEAAGYRVEIPPKTLCCGRPLYEFGMVPTAKRLLRQTLRTLAPQLRDGMPVIVLEPSCASVFRDELPDLFPDDEDARRLCDQTQTLAEALLAADYQAPSIDRRVIVQRHCHQQAVIGFDADRQILDATGADVEILDSGCCGMAGSFGYETHKYDVSVAVAERVLLPAVREAPADAIILADGFSCQGQIEQLGDRETLHLAQLLQLGSRDGAPVPTEDDDERQDERAGRRRAAAVGAAIAAAGGIAAVAAGRRRNQ